MQYTIHYAAECNKGLVRKVNQDNLWCNGTFLDQVNEGLPAPAFGSALRSNTPVIAVFDGMGGEKFGEHASAIAAATFDELYRANKTQNDPNFLVNTMLVINDRICKHGDEIGVRNMGTTGAVVMFDDNAVQICNVGDSRIYRWQNGVMTQVSLDHCLQIEGSRKAPLTQYLGVPASEFIIQPYIDRFPYHHGDRWLVCSDGLTDMVSEEDICALLTTCETPKEAAAKLREAALAGGGRDNLTILVGEVECDDPEAEAAMIARMQVNAAAPTLLTPAQVGATVAKAEKEKKTRQLLTHIAIALAVLAAVIVGLIVMLAIKKNDTPENEPPAVDVTTVATTTATTTATLPTEPTTTTTEATEETRPTIAIDIDALQSYIDGQQNGLLIDYIRDRDLFEERETDLVRQYIGGFSDRINEGRETLDNAGVFFKDLSDVHNANMPLLEETVKNEQVELGIELTSEESDKTTQGDETDPTAPSPEESTTVPSQTETTTVADEVTTTVPAAE